MNENLTRGDSIFFIELEKIVPNPYQPRREFDHEKLEVLADSIKQYGVLQPIVVSRKEEFSEEYGIKTTYEIIAGERRYRAAKMAGLKQIPAIIREGQQSDAEKLELAIIENLQREDLNPVDKAKAFKKLADVFGLTHATIAKKMGKSREYVSNAMRILMLPEHMLAGLANGNISEGHTRSLLMLKDRSEEQEELYRRIIKDKLTVRAAEKIARAVATDKIRKRIDVDPEIKTIEKHIREKLGTKVTIDQKPIGNGGRLTIEYFSKDELKKILSIIESQENHETKNKNTRNNDEFEEELRSIQPTVFKEEIDKIEQFRNIAPQNQQNNLQGNKKQEEKEIDSFARVGSVIGGGITGAVVDKVLQNQNNLSTKEEIKIENENTKTETEIKENSEKNLEQKSNNSFYIEKKEESNQNILNSEISDEITNTNNAEIWKINNNNDDNFDIFNKPEENTPNQNNYQKNSETENNYDNKKDENLNISALESILDKNQLHNHNNEINNNTDDEGKENIKQDNTNFDNQNKENNLENELNKDQEYTKTDINSDIASALKELNANFDNLNQADEKEISKIQDVEENNISVNKTEKLDDKIQESLAQLGLKNNQIKSQKDDTQNLEKKSFENFNENIPSLNNNDNQIIKNNFNQNSNQINLNKNKNIYKNLNNITDSNDEIKNQVFKTTEKQEEEVIIVNDGKYQKNPENKKNSVFGNILSSLGLGVKKEKKEVNEKVLDTTEKFSDISNVDNTLDTDNNTITTNENNENKFYGNNNIPIKKDINNYQNIATDIENNLNKKNHQIIEENNIQNKNDIDSLHDDINNIDINDNLDTVKKEYNQNQDKKEGLGLGNDLENSNDLNSSLNQLANDFLKNAEKIENKEIQEKVLNNNLQKNEIDNDEKENNNEYIGDYSDLYKQFLESKKKIESELKNSNIDEEIKIEEPDKEIVLNSADTIKINKKRPEVNSDSYLTEDYKKFGQPEKIEVEHQPIMGNHDDFLAAAQNREHIHDLEEEKEDKKDDDDDQNLDKDIYSFKGFGV